MSWQQIVLLIVNLLVAGPIVSLLVQLVKSVRWPSTVKAVLAVFVSLVVSLCEVYLAGDLGGLMANWGNLDATTVIAAALPIWLGAHVFFVSRFGDSEAMKKIGALIWGPSSDSA